MSAEHRRRVRKIALPPGTRTVLSLYQKSIYNLAPYITEEWMP